MRKDRFIAFCAFTLVSDPLQEMATVIPQYVKVALSKHNLWRDGNWISEESRRATESLSLEFYMHAKRLPLKESSTGASN